MLTDLANGNVPLSFWPRVREFAVPPSMIETATARRRAGDWAGACAAANVDADLRPRLLARRHGSEFAALLRADLRHLAPDLLRWHMPRVAPYGLLRPGLTLTLARYGTGTEALHLVARTPPAWADAGQRISLALWDASRRHDRDRRHPHPRPSRRFRLDLHRHLWDARRTGELRARAGDGGPIPETAGAPPAGPFPDGKRCAVDRWAAEAAILLRAEGRSGGRVGVRLGARHRVVLDLSDGGEQAALSYARAPDPSLPVLPDAATWVLPDLELLRAGAIDPGRLHPLVASALGAQRSGTRPVPERAGDPRVVECRGARHRIGLVDGVLAALDHDPAEVRREELLAAFGGPPLPCLRAVDEAHRRPECLPGVRERLHHGDTAGALAAVESLLGPEAVLRDGPLRDVLETAARRRIAHGLFRAGLEGPSPSSLRPWDRRRSRDDGPHPRHM
ncbi:hypothetical protein ADK65_13770 [Streptomyces sp. NRRL B-1140]|uniref:hypothetical protein n=1 Tax=Streptomyces sp. NRRL B-1140 TaxID=1415549 RepID=UPI0006ADBDCC|nr:hypothetical protein [Streptomyces sp. NRRL B-1140]KOX00697.1 hypothetical protein ADK65_13770 [Streptomyces sp. NRRL B-1140]